MSFLDVAILVVLVSAILGGYKLGLLTGVTAWLVLVQGLVLATLVLPSVDRYLIDLVSPGVALAIEGFIFVAAGFAGVYLGRWMGTSFKRQFIAGEMVHRDRVAGALAGPLAALVLVWMLVIPAMSQSRGWLEREVQRSVLARAIDGVFPAPPDTSRALHRLAGPAGQPQVFASLDPFFERVAPPLDSGLAPDVVARVSASTVKVEGVACRRARDGSGFAVEPELVVTNAHVVAGESRTSVIRPDGKRLPATVVAFDSDRDLALLRVPNLDQEALPLARPEPRATGAVFGHPGGQDALEISPAFVRREVAARGADLYAQRFVRRQILVLAAELQPGDSGSALVDQSGSVIGVAFAVSLDQGDTAYALSSDELEPLLTSDTSRRVDTGECLL